MSNKWHQYKIIGDTLPNLQDIHSVFLLNHELVGMQEYHELWKITWAEDKPLKAKGVDTSTGDCWIQALTKVWVSLLTLNRVPVGQKQKTKKTVTSKSILLNQLVLTDAWVRDYL